MDILLLENQNDSVLSRKTFDRCPPQSPFIEEDRATPHDICKERPVQLVPWCLRMAGFIFVNDGKDAWHYLFYFYF